MNVIVTAHTAQEIADQINAGFAAGTTRIVQGRFIESRWSGQPATAWGNGTVSVTVVGRTRGAVGQVFVKVGHRIVTDGEVAA